MKRFADWPARLNRFFEARELRPFAWGANDCSTFAADDVRELTGVDLLTDCSPRWGDATEAGLTIRRERGLLGALNRRLGAPLQTPALAQRGDVLLVRAPLAQGHTRFVAVCDSDRWAAPGAGGLLRGPLAQAVKAWRV